MTTANPAVEAGRWLRYPGEDLAAAITLLQDEESVPRQSCSLAQQAAEKAIKAVLVFTQTEFPKRHDLDALRNLIPPGWQFSGKFPDLAELTEWAVEARYPGDWPEASSEDARRAIATTRALLAAIEQELRERDQARPR